MPPTKTIITIVLISGLVVWASNNIDSVKKAIGDTGWFS